MATAWTASPYRVPVIGWMSDLESMRAEDALAWYRDWYTPSNAILVIAGDVSGEEAWRLAERTYGRIEARALPPRKPQAEPPQRGLRRAWVKAPAESPYVVLGFKVPRLADVEREYGRDLTIWGGSCDTQRVLPFGTEQEVRDETRRRIEDLAPGGGYVFAPIHVIQAGVPPENIIAWWETLMEYGLYKET